MDGVIRKLRLAYSATYSKEVEVEEKSHSGEIGGERNEESKERNNTKSQDEKYLQSFGIIRQVRYPFPQPEEESRRAGKE